jgi:hypothetical protein
MTQISLSSNHLTISIHNLTLEDPRAHRILSMEAPERVEQKLRDALTIGFLAIDRTAAMAETDWVTQRLESQVAAVNYALERRSNEVMELIRNQFDPTKAGSLLSPVTELVQRTQREMTTRLTDTVAAVAESQESIGRILNENFDPDSRSSRIHQFANQMNDLISRLEGSIDPRKDGTVLKEFLTRFESLTKEVSTSPVLQAKLDGLRDEIKSMVTAMKIGADAEEAIDKARDAAIDASPAKGMLFEDQVISELKRIAEIRNDLIEPVGSSPGKGSSKKGDLTYYISVIKARMVYELKDYGGSRFTFQKIKDLMEESRNNRDALFGLFVVKDEACLPDGVGRFFIADDFLIATQDFLEVATKVGILMAQYKVSRMGSVEGPDWVTIEANLEGVRTAIDELSDLESGCMTAQKAITKTADGIRRLSRTLTEKVEGILGQLSKKEGE